WNRLRTKLVRLKLLRQYALAVEPTRAGAWHVHVLATGAYIDQAKLSRLALAAGFGRITDIKLVRGARGASRYATKAANYVAKAARAAEALASSERDDERERRRFRPVRLSRQWYPGGLTRAEAELAEQRRQRALEAGAEVDPGPWVLVADDGARRT